jgi:hypothetical protein
LGKLKLDDAINKRPAPRLPAPLLVGAVIAAKPVCADLYDPLEAAFTDLARPPPGRIEYRALRHSLTA